MPSPIYFKRAVYCSKDPHWQYRPHNPPFAVHGPVHMHVINETPWGFRGPWEFIDGSNTTIIEQSTFLSLLLVSGTFYKEAMPIYFRHNIFDFDNLSRCQYFLDRISPDARWQVGEFTYDPQWPMEKLTRYLSQVSRLRVTWTAWSGATAGRVARLMCRCPNLRGLAITLSHDATAWTPKGSPHKLQLHGMGALLKVRGLTDLEVEVPRILYCYEKECTHDAAYRPLGNKKDIEDLVQRLQVLKQPWDAKDLEKLAKKDFPD